MKNIALLITTSLVSAFLAVFIYSYICPIEVQHQEKHLVQQVKSDLLFSDRMNGAFHAAAPSSFTTAAKQSVDAVVFISAIQHTDGPNKFTRNMNTATGSGVIISTDGYIVTNHHVVDGAKGIEVLLNDNREYKATLIGTDPTTDLALLKINSDNLPFLVMGNSDSLQIGEWVLAVGNPFRLQSTVTAGIVSAKARNINILSQQGIESFIQTDAAVNPGNSGGALVDTRGNLVGINAAIMSNSGKYEGYSFAIPANLAKKVIYDLREFGAVQRGWLGITIVNVDADKADQLAIPDVGGVYLEMVNRDGAAQEAGLRRNDVLVSVNNKITNTVPEFMERVAAFRPGDVINVGYYRNGSKKMASITLRNQLNTTDFIAVRRDQILKDLGFELRDLDTEENKRMQADGVMVVSIYNNSTIEATNMEPGFIITKVGNIDVTDTKQFIKYLSNHNGLVEVEGFYEKYPGTYPYTFVNK